MVRTIGKPPRPATPPVDEIIRAAPNAQTAIAAWLGVFVRLLRLSDVQRLAIRNELQEHLRERTRDLMLTGRTETEAVRLAIEELGETAQLARRFESANRPNTRRWLMYTSMLGFSAAIFITGSVVLTPDHSQPTLASIFKEEQAQHSQTLEKLINGPVDVKVDLPVLETARVLSEVAKVNIDLPVGELTESGIPSDHVITMELENVPLRVALDQFVSQISQENLRFAWRAEDGRIEIGRKHVIDLRENVLVSYNIAEIIKSLTTYGRPYDNAVEDITGLVESMVEADNWRENGGELAHLRVVGGKMFVEAPKRMHERIEWILLQLRESHGNAEGAQPAAKHRTTLEPGDCLSIGIFELYQPNQWHQVWGVVDGDGLISLPEIGEVNVAGMKRAEVVQVLTDALQEKVMINPKVHVEFHIENALAKQASRNAEAVDPDTAKWELARLNLNLQKAKDNLALIEARFESGGASKAEMMEAEYALKAAELEVTAFTAQAAR